MRTFATFCILSALLAGCEPGLATDELAAGLRPAYLSGQAVPQCRGLEIDADAHWEAVAYSDDLVLVERDGYPVCLDGVAEVSRWASDLGLPLILPVMPASSALALDPAETAPSRPGQDTHSNHIGDDPVPLGKGDQTQSTPTQ